jgi:hypothetical protein
MGQFGTARDGYFIRNSSTDEYSLSFGKLYYCFLLEEKEVSCANGTDLLGVGHLQDTTGNSCSRRS